MWSRQYALAHLPSIRAILVHYKVFYGVNWSETPYDVVVKIREQATLLYYAHGAAVAWMSLDKK